MFIIGLTGGIGSGKSTVASFFATHTDIVNADEIARRVVQPDSSALDTIATHFGSKAILQDGTLNRRWVRDKIFSDVNEKVWLENLLHPLIRTEIITALHNSKSPYTILMSPLLLETDQHLLVNRTLVIDTPEDTQIERVIKRDETSSEIVKAIMSEQLPRLSRLQKADDIIVNTGDMVKLEKSIAFLHDIYLRWATGS